MDTKDFISKARVVHGTMYNYDKVDYINNYTKVCVVCPNHGEFWQKPSSHLSHHGCRLCAGQVASTEEFVAKATKVHRDYDYSKVVYVSAHAPIIIICRIHGEFLQTPLSHCGGRGCKKCADDATRTPVSEFIKKAVVVHNNKYDYSDMVYTNAQTKVCIICSKHGKFYQNPLTHLYGHGCALCAAAVSNTNEFIKKAMVIHGNKYDYTKTDYVRAASKICVICKTHGEFWQKPNAHLSKKTGCPACANTQQTIIQFIEKARITHTDKYDYSKVTYTSRSTKVCIICPVHGEFWQTPSHHWLGSGCRQCVHDNYRSSTNEFVEKAMLLHGDGVYDYTSVDYKTAMLPVRIKCKTHGEFLQTPNCHLAGSGCPSCPVTISNNHQAIAEFIAGYNIEVINNDRQTIKPYEIDILLPNHSLGIEHHGIFYHSKSEPGVDYRPINKYLMCAAANTRLIQIFEHEWWHKTPIVKSIILSKLGITNRLGARGCEIKIVNSNQQKQFIDACHIQGYKPSTICGGLYHEDELVMIMSFNRHPKYQYELNRLATKLNTTIVGGASRLFKWFLRQFNPESIISYADIRYSDGGVYRALGFNGCGRTKPNYFYLKSDKIYSRQMFQKHKLSIKLPNFDPTKTEIVNMLNNKYRLLWDAGHWRFIWRRPVQPVSV